MKEPVKIENTPHYQELLNKLVSVLYDTLPVEEQPDIDFSRSGDIVMEYGPSAVKVNITTKTYGKESYIIYLNANNNAEFIRTFQM